jgi:hypothetical protein
MKHKESKAEHERTKTKLVWLAVFAAHFDCRILFPAPEWCPAGGMRDVIQT